MDADSCLCYKDEKEVVGSPPKVWLRNSAATYLLAVIKTEVGPPFLNQMQGNRRVQSISLKNLNLLLEILAEETKLWYAEVDTEHEILSDQKKEPTLHVGCISSHLLAAYLKAGSGEKHLHAAKKYSALFSKKRARAVLTYQWKLALGGNTGVVKILEDSGIPPDTELWIDVWFVDQNSRNIGDKPHQRTL